MKLMQREKRVILIHTEPERQSFEECCRERGRFSGSQEGREAGEVVRKRQSGQKN